MGVHGQARISMVSYSIDNSELVKDPMMGRLQGIIVHIEGASALVDLEVIEIVDDNNPYPMLLGIDWATDMNGVINLISAK